MIKTFLAYTVLFVLLTGTAFALPPLPPRAGQPQMPGDPQQPGSPPGPNQPNLPPQPSLPPCPECEEFFPTKAPTLAPQEPTPTTVLEQPTPTKVVGAPEATSTSLPAGEEGAAAPTGEVDGEAAGEAVGAPAQEAQPEVLGLAVTSSGNNDIMLGTSVLNFAFLCFLFLIKGQVNRFLSVGVWRD